MYVPIVTLSSKDNAKLVKLLEDGFDRPAYWNEYQTKIETRNLDNKNLTRFLLDASFQEVRRLFVPAFDNTDDGAKKVERNSHTKYFIPRGDITNYNVLIDRRNFCDQPINDIIKKYDEIRKITTGQGDNYTTGCLLDYQHFKNHYDLIAIDLSKRKELDADSRAIQQIEFYGIRKELDADSRAIQQIEFYGIRKTNSQVCTVLEKSKETTSIFKGTAKVL